MKRKKYLRSKKVGKKITKFDEIANYLNMKKNSLSISLSKHYT